MKEDLQEKIDKAKIALRCLYVAVPESIAHDVERKVEDVFALLSAPEPAETGERLEGWAFHMEAGAWHFESDPEHEPTVADERATLIIRSDQ
jgi:hypothetical protein